MAITTLQLMNNLVTNNFKHKLIMKNIFIKFSFLLTLCLYSCNTNSQIIITRGGNNGNLPQNFKSTGQYYYKDVNNYLDNFVGTWEYINGNEKFQIILTKITNFHSIDTDLNLNFYEDGIVLQYKKYTNNVLTFESPIYNDPNFRTTNGVKLEGSLSDYGRITKTVVLPPSNLVWHQGGEPIYPRCDIEKLANQPNKISFKLHSGPEHGHKGYDKETYAGQPTYSIPNNIIMDKVN